MSVSQGNFVEITSGVGAATTVAQRQLVPRIMTDSSLLPPQSYIEFPNLNDDAANVGAYFGEGSPEQLRAQYVLSWVSKNIKQVPLISFGRWVDTAVAGVIYGAQAAYALGSFSGISNGALNLTIGETQTTISGINLTGAGSLAAVATAIQTAIQAHSAGGQDWEDATVAYVAAPAQGGKPQFVLTGGVIGPEAMAIGTANTGVDLGPLLGWANATAIIGQGSAVETVTETLDTTINLSNNFGSFAFIPSLTTLEVTQAAEWNNGQNVFYQFMVPVTAANAATIIDAIADFAGCGVTLSPIADDFPELIPTAVLGATDYTAQNSVQDYDYQDGFPSTPSVLSDADFETYSNLGVNFYLQTQNAGQDLDFYANGVLTGTATDPVDMNTYANEQWLKDALGAQLLTMLLALPTLSADNDGVAQTTGVLQSVINQALFNGTIVVGKPLDEIQQLYITNATGSNTAWQQVQNSGYWLNVVIVPYVVDNVTKYKMVYTLIYSKADAIRFIQGSDILI